MKKTIWLFALCSCIISVSYSQTWQWTHPEPNGNTYFNQSNYAFEGDVAHKVATDAQGFVYVLGNYGDSLYLNGVLRTNGQPSGSYIAKYDSTGNLIWYKLITLTNNDDLNNTTIDASDMVVNASGIFIVGKVYSGDYVPFNYKIGNTTFTIDTTGEYLYGSAVTNEFFFCKLSLNGTLNWNKTSHLANIGVYELSLATDMQNNVVVGGVRTDPHKGNTSILLTSFMLGGDSITNHTNHSINGWPTIFIAKYTSGGVYQWANFVNGRPAGCSDNFPASVICDNNNNVWIYNIVADSTYFENALFRTPHNDCAISTLSKLSSSGSFLFTHELSTYSEANGFENICKPRLLACDNANNIYALVNLIEGNSQPYLNGNIAVDVISLTSELYTLKYNNNGDLLWYKLCGNISEGNDDNRGAQINYFNGNLWYAGGLEVFSYKAWDWYKFDPLSVPYLEDKTHAVGFRYFVAKADTSGNFSWVTTFHSNNHAFAYSVAAYGNNIYTAGSYHDQIYDLGNLKGYVSATGIENQFLGKLKDQYIRVGAISATQVIPGCSITVPFTSYGLTFSASNKFTAELSNASGDFTSPKNIGTTTSTGTGSITATIPNNLPFGSTGYRIRIKSSDTLLTGYPYYAYADTGYIISIACSPAPSGLTSTNITGTSANLNWNAVPCAKGYKVQYRVNGTTKWTTVQVATNIGSVTVTGLTANTTYQWRVATKCKSGTTTEYSSYTKNKQFTTAASFVFTDNIAVENSNIILTPNPAHSSVIVNFETNDAYTELEIINATAQTVFQKKVTVLRGKNVQQVDVSKLSSGVYTLLVKTNSGIQNRRFVKE